ncbi:MAG: hypothetical protein WAR57_15330 [Candidatus Phosphoribacter sp.]|nr:hypothetical protein [Actinomycetales bacterium]
MSTPTTNTGTSTPAPRTALSTRPDKKRPSTAGYWVGTLVAVLTTLSALGWGAFAFLGWQAHVEDFCRLTDPGTAAVSVTRTGARFVYLEHDRTTAPPSVLPVTVTGPSGVEVPLTAYRAELRYDVPNNPNRVGDAVLTFPADEPGTYAIFVADIDEGTAVAVGDDLLRTWAPQVVGSVALLLGGLLLGLILVIVTAVRRAGPTS